MFLPPKCSMFMTPAFGQIFESSRRNKYCNNSKYNKKTAKTSQSKPVAFQMQRLNGYVNSRLLREKMLSLVSASVRQNSSGHERNDHLARSASYFDLRLRRRHGDRSSAAR